MMKCPYCKERTLKMTTYRRKHGYASRKTEQGIFTCSTCGHKEVFG